MICSQGRTYAKIIWQPQPPTHAQHSLIVGTHYDTDFIIIIDPLIEKLRQIMDFYLVHGQIYSQKGLRMENVSYASYFRKRL